MYIYPDNAALQYSGRIDFDCPAEPVFVYAASYVKLIFTGTFVKVKISNRRNYWTNYIGAGAADGSVLRQCLLR